MWLSKNQIRNDKSTFSYKLSQYLIFEKYALRVGKISESFDYFQYLSDDNISKAAKELIKYRENIRIFYEEIRNHINHGTTIQRKQQIVSVIEQVLRCINMLGRSSS